MSADTYIIPTSERETIEKAVARYQKKAASYGCQFSISYGEPYAKERAIFDTDYDQNGIPFRRHIGKQMIEVFDVTIESDLIRKDGYAVVAKIEHLDGGNVVSTFGEEGKPEWSNLKPRCQHCGGNHGQKITFIVRHEDGTELQVGRTCLKDYCGIDPKRIAYLNQLRDLFLDEDIDHHDFVKHPAVPAFYTSEALALAIHVMKAQGYVKSEENGSNREVMGELVRKNYRATEKELDEAEALANQIVALDQQTARGALLDNVQTLIRSGYCKGSHFGFIAYAPLAFKRYTEKMEKQREREAAKETERCNSEHIGQIGQRIEIEIAEMALITSWETQYGFTHLYKFVDKNGNILVWFASKHMSNADKIKATIKEHSERDGVKQTVITRCTAIPA